MILYKISVFIHILSAMFWMGGMLFTMFVIVPSLRQPQLSPNRGDFFSIMGQYFSQISWLIFIILLITGYYQLAFRGYHWEKLLSSEFWHTHFGFNLLHKLIYFAFMLIISGIHDFWLGPKTAELIRQKPEHEITNRYRKITSWVGRINFIFGLCIVYYAISLVRG
ncbi:MAG: DUF4149 domain-containing protein [Chitinophagales bacterium]|nr:DUF4149 domain-containing protein [Chitinophagales bacterium]MCZ2392756.1 DUF4149 domain-containing protein [Chitinophagales bacterium]